MDSTIKSNLTVGLPLDMLIYERDALKVGKQVTITAQNTYFNDLRNRWGECLRNAFEELPAPDWDASF